MRDPCVVWYIASKVTPNISLSRLEDRLLLQKIAYIVQEILGYGLGYRFSWYSYGPYSRTLSRDLHTYEDTCLESSRGYDVEKLVGVLDRFTRVYVSAQALCPSESMARVLEIVASLHMLSVNTYPPSRDPVEDLARIKPYIDKACAKEIFELMKSLGVVEVGDAPTA